MEDCAGSVGVTSRPKVTKTNSRFVSEAFSFLSEPGYLEDELDGVPRISTSLSETRLSDFRSRQPLDLTEHGRKSNFNQSAPESLLHNSDEHFTIVTSVEPDSSLNGVANGNNVTPPDQGTDGRLDTDMEVRSIPGSVKSRNSSHSGSVTSAGGRIIETETDLATDAKSEEFTIVAFVDQEHQTKSELKEPVVDNSSQDPDEVVLRRQSGDIARGRQPTWRHNQHVVSEAFQFLADIDGLSDTQSIISEYFPGFDATDTEAGMQPKQSDSVVDSETSPVRKPLLRTDAVDVSCLDTDIDKKSSLEKDTSEPTHPEVRVNSTPVMSSPESLAVDSSVRVTKSEGSSEEHLSSVAENDDVGELGAAKLRNRRRGKPQKKQDEDDGDSSDDDKGVYRESFRKSTWLYVGDSSDLSVSEPGSNSTKESGYNSLSDLDGPERDSVFETPPDQTVKTPLSHKRSESTTTTASEREFRNGYNSVRKCYVQRADSQQEYKRMTAKFYDQQKEYVLRKEPDAGYGIHVLDSGPAVITGVDTGSPADTAGVREGQILIAINSVNVLEAAHDEIIRLVQENSTQLILEVGYSDVNCVRDLQLPLMTGYLMKQTSSTIFKTWKRRFFILRQDNCLYYYKNEQAPDPLGAIQLTGYVVSRHGDFNKFGFKAEKFGNRPYYFQAESRDEMTNWVGALNDSAEKGKDRKDSWMDVTSHNVGLPALEIRKPDCSGNLFKLTRGTRRWGRRYCVLKDACIYYYKSSSSKEAEGVAHLHGYTVDSDGVGGKRCSFCLRPPEPQMRVFSFYADNNTDKDRWVDALRKSIQKWVRVE